jgi:hypothetical protein
MTETELKKKWHFVYKLPATIPTTNRFMGDKLKEVRDTMSARNSYLSEIARLQAHVDKLDSWIARDLRPYDSAMIEKAKADLLEGW